MRYSGALRRTPLLLPGRINRATPDPRYSRGMPLRTFLLHSRAGRVLCVAVLALFLLLCGIHIGSVHHDDHDESLGLATQMILFIFVVVAVLLVAEVLAHRRSGRNRETHHWIVTRLWELPSLDLTLEAPLRC